MDVPPVPAWHGHRSARAVPGRGCPSRRQPLLMDGFRALLAPCSQFAVFPLEVIINPVIAAALHNFLVSGGQPSIHPSIAGCALPQVTPVLPSSAARPCPQGARIPDGECPVAAFGEGVPPRW